MSGIRSRDTRPELAVRSLLHRMGFRFRLHRKDLPGKPDIVLPRYRVALFVHGCFWHQHSGCPLASNPSSNTVYWTPKLLRNLERDAENRAALEALGWRTGVVWECETRKPNHLNTAVTELLAKLRIFPRHAAMNHLETGRD